MTEESGELMSETREEGKVTSREDVDRPFGSSQEEIVLSTELERSKTTQISFIYLNLK